MGNQHLLDPRLGLTFDADDLADSGAGFPAAGELGTTGVTRIDALDIQVLGVDHRGGDAPGDVSVVADQNAGRAGCAGSRHVELAARRQVRFVKDTWKAREHVRIVGEQGLAGAGPRARHSPGVAGAGPTGQDNGW